jgi:hypothetical protein
MALAPDRTIDVLLAEYAALKAEQLARIGTRDNLLYATLAVIGGVLAAALSSRQPACLLLVPPATVILGHTYLANDLKISGIREYIRVGLARRMIALTDDAGTDPLPFGWEFVHLIDPMYSGRRKGHLAVDLLAFAVAPAAAITVCLAAYSGPALVTAAVFLTAVAEAVSSAALARHIIRTYQRPAIFPEGSRAHGVSA